MMPATLAAPHAAVAVESVCGDCAGTCQVLDDGSISGVAGAVIPCGCTLSCPNCHGTGEVFGLWVIDADLEIYDEGFRPCHCKGGA